MDTPGLTADNPTEAPRRRRKLLVRAVLGCATVFFVAVTVLALIAVPNWIDGPPVEDADLTPPVPDIPPEENAGPLLMEFFADEEMFALLEPYPEDRFPEDYEDLMACDAFGEEFSEERWRDSDLRAWIIETEKGSAPALDRLEEIVARPRSWVPPVESYEDEQALNVLHLRKLADFMFLTARVHRLEGSPERALHRLHILLRTAQHGLRSPQTIIHLLVARALGQAALEDVRRALEANAPAGLERRFISEIEAWPGSPTMDTYAILRAYQLQRATILGMSESASANGLTGMDGLLFRPNDTVRQLAEYYRLGIAEGEATGRCSLDGEEYFELYPPPSRWSQLVEGNAAGKALIALLALDVDLIYRKGQESRVATECTRALLGLSVYHREHDRLPDSLTELVPEILSTVPTDPWNGQPLRYDPERRVIWSIGTDGVDGGAVDRPEDEWDDGLDTDDPYVEIPEW